MGETGHVDSTDVGAGAGLTLPPVGAFTPLRIPLFRDRWIAATVSGVGTWMQDTAGTWLMTALTASPLLIALMQTAASLPVLLLGVLAGATADIFDRRRLLIFWQCSMLGCVALLSLLTFAGWISPLSLLIFTFLLNIGSAMNNPAWGAIVPELVPKEQLPSAVTLNATSNNIARAIGPALGGLLVATFVRAQTGAASVFLLNAASFAGVIWILVRWRRAPLSKSALPAERIAGSVRTGLHYLRHAPDLQRPLLRAFLFTFCVSAVWSLLALVAKSDLHQGAVGYGILNGCLGVGAVGAAATLAWIRRRVAADTLLAVMSVYYVAALVTLALVRSPWVILPALLGAGFAWTATMSTLSVSVQLSAPGWVYARALGLYLMVFQGGLALGSILWGAIAEHRGTQAALLAAAACMAATLPFTLRIHILKGVLPDLTPFVARRSIPAFAATPQPGDGPVRISVDYRVVPGHFAEFTRAIHEMQGVRLRDGAVRWGIYRDAADPEHMNETFLMESWLDYLRSRERTTAADQAVRARVWALHSGPEPPRISHQVWVSEIAEHG